MGLKTCSHKHFKNMAGHRNYSIIVPSSGFLFVLKSLHHLKKPLPDLTRMCETVQCGESSGVNLGFG